MKKIITIVAILHLIFLSQAASNTLQFDAEANISAETDRYLVRFEQGVLAYFHNKLTQETYTQANLAQEENWRVGETFFGTLHRRVNHLKDIEKISPLQVAITYQEDGTTHTLLVGIDSKTGDLLIQQTGVHPRGGVESVSWGLKDLSHVSADIILPAMGGILITEDNTEHPTYRYPGNWEAQLAIFQGSRGGFFVRADDTQFRFKEMLYESKGEQFRISFSTIAFAPFEQRQQLTSPTWRLNAYRGGWKVPAQMYREWMYAAFSPPNHNASAWVNDIECVIKNHGELDLEMLAKLNQLVDPSKTLIYIYSWHEDGGDPPH